MESERVAMMMMIVMVMGNLVVETKALSSHFKVCYSDCYLVCKSQTNFPKSILCPFTCLRTCLVPTLPVPHNSDLTDKTDNVDYFCKLGCASHYCVSLSSLQNPNMEKVAKCVDSCSDKCSKEKKK